MIIAGTNSFNQGNLWAVKMMTPLVQAVEYHPGITNVLVVVPSVESAGGKFSGDVAYSMSLSYGHKAIINKKYDSKTLNPDDLSVIDNDSEVYSDFLNPILNILKNYNDASEACVLVVLEGLNTKEYADIVLKCSNNQTSAASAIFANGDMLSDKSNMTVDFEAHSVRFDEKIAGMSVLHAKPRSIPDETMIQARLGALPSELNQISGFDGYRLCKSFKVYFDDGAVHQMKAGDLAELISGVCNRILQGPVGSQASLFTGNSYALHKSSRKAKTQHAKQSTSQQSSSTRVRQGSSLPVWTREEFESELVHHETIVENANTVISGGLHREIKNYVEERFRSNHFSPGEHAKLLSLVKHIDADGVSQDFDLERAARDYYEFDQKFDSLQKKDEAFYAYLSIQLGKALNSFAKILKHRQSLLASEVSKKELQAHFDSLLFRKSMSPEARRYRMKIAQIPSVERWFFLGLNRLMQIQPLVEGIETNDPIGTFLGCSEYKFSLEKSSNEDFGLMFKKYLNMTALSAARVELGDPVLEQLTKAFPKPITTKLAKNILNGVKNGSSLHAVVTKLLSKKSPAPMTEELFEEVDMAPSWNTFDETCLKLQQMMEELLDNEIVPDYPSFITSSALKGLISLAMDLDEHWNSNWKDYKI